MQQILKLTSKEKTQDMSAQSWWKKNKRRNPVKYDIQRIFDKSGLNEDSLKWYYPDSRTRERNKERNAWGEREPKWGQQILMCFSFLIH